MKECWLLVAEMGVCRDDIGDLRDMTLDVAGRGREGSGRTGRAHPAERGRSIRARAEYNCVVASARLDPYGKVAFL